jgi:dienelactone hydrolase
MSDVIVFHHALGVTPGVDAFADRLRAAGHRVLVPDLFGGRRFDSIDAGVAHAGDVGFDVITERGVASARDREVTGGYFVVGFSLGVLPAQKLAQTDPEVRGAVLCHAAVPVTVFAERWPAGVAAQLHLVEDDPWAAEDLEAAREVAAASGGDLHLYPGHGHLVADASHPDFDPDVADRIVARTLDLLAAG